jgi:hypothetical protein
MSFRFAVLSWAIVLLFFARSLHSIGIAVTAAEMELDLAPEYNRVFGSCLTFSASGSLELNRRYALIGGLSLWRTADAYELDAAAGFKARLIPAWPPLSASVSYYLNALPAYELVSHTALPLVAFRFRRGGFALGTALRFSSFFGERAIFEAVPALEGYVHVYDTETFLIRLRCANFDAFTAGNFGAYRLDLDSRMRASKLVSLINSLELLQTGSVTLGANLYGLIFKMGVALAW